MIRDMKKFFQDVLSPVEDDDTGPERGIEHATAALLLELSKADFEHHTEEREFIIGTLKRAFDLDQEALNELIEWADAATDDAHDLYQFTKLVNEHYSHADKEKLLENLWKVAYVDGRIDRYEEQFVRKVAGLLHLAHSSFIKAKLSAREAMDY